MWGHIYREVLCPHFCIFGHRMYKTLQVFSLETTWGKNCETFLCSKKGKREEGREKHLPETRIFTEEL